MAKAELIVAGQRWVSDAEPELGVGYILGAGDGKVEILFPAAQERRLYALASSPLRRVSFRSGDTLQTRAGEHRLVLEVQESGGLLSYATDAGMIAEAEISETISYSKPEERLLAGQSDPSVQFELRVRALHRLAGWRASPLRGFIGPRMVLIPHQMAIAVDVSARQHPRVLLCDEVGLGKTIEACLILHRMLLTGRISRVLILVPDALIHQWFVELLRRFNLSFCHFDEEHFDALLERSPTDNPFLDEQLVLCGTSFLRESSTARQLCLAAGWDLLIVDEAHHLDWTPQLASEAYRAVEALARATPGVLLLTATPQQLGLVGHFGRLRLLDPERYPDLELFKQEIEGYNAIAQWTDALEASPVKSFRAADLPPCAGAADSWQRYLSTWKDDEVRSRQKVVAEVMEYFGPGRVIFRNTRTRLAGFPPRNEHLVALDGDMQSAWTVKLTWLIELLQKLRKEKILLICKSKELAEQLVDALASLTSSTVTLFHEGLSLMQRDRCAAYFSEADGAQMLVCSEIGSEGRNFQFAHHLVLWDLPWEPDLLEQRIGRLDRIGQKSRIHLHVPYIKASAEEVLARWYAEGLGAFTAHVPGAHQLGEQFIPRLQQLTEPVDEAELAERIAETQLARKQMAERLRTGRDRLLAVSRDQRRAIRDTIDAIRTVDADFREEAFLVDLLEEIGVQVDDEGGRAFRLDPVRLKHGSLPFLPRGGIVATFSREEALAREEWPFLSVDHPLIEAALETFLQEGQGNAACAVWKQAGDDGIFLETIFVAEGVAPPRLHLDRFFPPTPLRKVIDHRAEDVSGESLWRLGELESISPQRLLEKRVVRQRLIPDMIKKAHSCAQASLVGLQIEAAKTLRAQLDPEIHRLQFLSTLNQLIHPQEAEELIQQKAQLLEAIGNAHLRLDAVRMVWRRNE